VDATLQPEAEEDVAVGGRVGDGVDEVLLCGVGTMRLVDERCSLRTTYVTNDVLVK